MDATAVAAPETNWKYWAFISYSHADNRESGRRWADWLHEALETYEIPAELATHHSHGEEPFPNRIYPVFQDEKELPTSANLGAEIEDALRRSAFLIVLCSHHAARSIWVSQEIIFFKKLGREARILPLILSGEPNASEPGKKGPFSHEDECFPEALRYGIDQEGNIDRSKRVEPIAADLRSEGGGQRSTEEISDAPFLDREKLRIIAGVLRVGFDELIQRDKQRQILKALREQEERKENARQLVAGVKETLSTLKKTAPTKGADYLFGTLGEAEGDLQDAMANDADNPEAIGLLKQVRRMVVESAIRSGDLNTASLFLQRLTKLGPADAEENRILTRSLNNSWELSDPKRNGNIQSMLQWTLVGVALTALWAVAGFWLLKQWNAELAPIYVSAVIVLGVVPLVIMLSFLIQAKLGYEQGLGNAFVTAYIAFFAGLFTLNLPAAAVAARVLMLASKPETLSVVWAFAKNKE